ARPLHPPPIGRLPLLERSCGITNAAQVREQRPAVLALLQVHLELRAADCAERAVDQILDLRDVASASHRPLPPAYCLLLSPSSTRNRNRALCTCDFDVPSAIPSTSATSRCSNPSTSCNTNAARHPSGNCASARSRSIRPIARSPSRCSPASAITVASSS